MANIMITKRCNLRCEYCFANEFVNTGKSSDITADEFIRLLDFILLDGTERKLGLIGGEPTIHSRFGDLLEILIKEKRVQNTIIYTNGIELTEHLPFLKDTKFNLLVNCNDLSFSETLSRRFEGSMDAAFEIMGDRIVLGANFYKPDYDYSYILRLAEKYSCRRLRVSISLPNTPQKYVRPLEYFSEVKNAVFDFFRKLKALNVVPFLDCNIFPPCLVTVDEMREFESWGADNPLSVIKNRQTGCIPVIDILPDGTAVRCFGLSEYTKTNIRDFACISDLRSYYMRTVDAYAINSVSDDKCTNCYKFKTMKCSGGCLIYKIDKICSKQRSECF